MLQYHVCTSWETLHGNFLSGRTATAEGFVCTPSQEVSFIWPSWDRGVFSEEISVSIKTKAHCKVYFIQFAFIPRIPSFQRSHIPARPDSSHRLDRKGKLHYSNRCKVHQHRRKTRSCRWVQQHTRLHTPARTWQRVKDKDKTDPATHPFEVILSLLNW